MKCKTLVVAGLLASTVWGCSTLTGVGKNGEPQGELVWPDVPDDVTLDHKRGTYGDMNRIALIRDGATRDDIYQLIGRPQFGEGFHVREWDYLFYFTREDGSEQACQYKVLFDKDLIARNMYWHPVNTTDGSCPPSQNITLSADALFHFDGGGLADLLAEGRAGLDRLASMLDDRQIKSIGIYGYTDRLGTAAYNYELSQQRAETVKAYLVNRGIDGALITAEGRGEANPVSSCDNLERNALIRCLQPDRRVEVRINR